VVPRIAPGTVSIKSLRADPNGKAARELEQALWDVRYKNWKGAVKHFEKSLKADEAYSRASANWAILEVQLGNAVKAEAIARKALRHDPKNLRLRHVLAASLVAQGVLTDETVTSFADAGAESPQALLAAAHVEFQRGNWSSVRKYAKAYLQSGDKEHRDFAERLKALPDTAK
jgi:tetratricopeptide (TPR) repeat protein